MGYEVQEKIVREKIARLKALRLAKEACERKNSERLSFPSQLCIRLMWTANEPKMRRIVFSVVLSQ